ncbi:DUF4855 domain-containing protein [Paenibacillus chibensis]|uniref:DUF4855 domain-containing protein n=1 Tax=Paenibacillus chibensis TaxID=59846 RepID=UPI000FD9B035|nr:DUF4855 domain-containing protein [Paenibacillus chibensis]MEC0372561.1 DUF4855 domain-containing protein [Paenibacillus chibensis]
MKMKWNKKWASILAIAALLLTPVHALQAKESGMAAQVLASANTGMSEGNEGTEPAPGTGEPDAGSGSPEAEQPAANPGGTDAGPEQPADGEHDPANHAEKAEGEAGQPAAPEETQQTEPRNLAAGLSYTWSEEPDASHPDNGNQLTDGVYGALDMNDPAWVGHWHKKTREVVFDLGEDKSISSVKANFLKDYPANSILNPLTVSMYVSDDNVHWGLLSDNATQRLWGEEPATTETYEWDGSRDGIKGGNPSAKMAYARYVKVTFTMHPTQWTFIDEIEIWGLDGRSDGAATVPAKDPQFMAPGDATAGIRNLGLLYNGQYKDGLGDWTKERIIPNISYVDKDGHPTDWLFDGVLYLGLSSPAGHDFGLGQANLDEWKWYLNKTFQNKGDMEQLNEATREVAEKLNQPDYKEKVVLMVPNPGESLSDFGDVDGDGISENFNASGIGREKALANRLEAVDWWLDQVERTFQNANYSNLELAGIYWLDEQISTSPDGPDLLRAVSGKIHDKQLKFFWIPHFMGYKVFMWKDVGFDAVAFQPNYFFEQTEYDRFEDAANLAKQYGISNEVEFDDRMLSDGVFRERYIDYLNSGVETGLMQNGFRAYYQGNNAVYNAAMNADPSNRVLYDWLYQYVKGTYQINNAAPPEAVVQMNGQPFQSGAAVTETEPVKFTWQLKNDDGSGLTKVTAMFDGKPYTSGTALDLTGKPGKHELIVAVTAGKSQKTSYIIRAVPNADSMITLVNRFAEQKQFANAEGPRALNNYLKLMKRYEGKDAAREDVYLKGFNTKLDLLKKQSLVQEQAYGSLKEDVYDLAGNLAENKPAQASSIEGNNENYAPSKAVDGFPATRWASNYDDNSWYQVDLGESRTLDTIRMDWEYARAKTYKILVSDDKQNWVSVVKDNGGIITAHDGKETLRFDPVKARYVKFQGIQRNTDYGYSFYEFGVYQLPDAPEAKPIDGLRASVDDASRKITLDGLVMTGELAQVKLKVLDPKGKVNVEAQTASTEAGDFRFAFTLKGEAEGIYEAYVSMDGMTGPEKVTFEYKKASTGGGNGGTEGSGGNGSQSGSANAVSTGTAAAPSANFRAQPDGSVRAILASKLEADGTTASGAIGGPELLKAISLATTHAGGTQKIVLELSAVAGASQYAVDLPADVLLSHPGLRMEVITPKASATFASKTLSSIAVGVQPIRFKVSERDLQSLDPAVRKLAGSRPAVQLEFIVNGTSVSWKDEEAPMNVSVPYERAGNESTSGIGVMLAIPQQAGRTIRKAAYDDAGKFVTFEADRTGVYTVIYVEATPEFADIETYPWAKDAIETLAASGIVKGTSAGAFSPAEQVTRGDFILMLVRALGLKAEADGSFTDVKPQDYYAEAVATAKQLGIVIGMNNGQFKPNAKITREDMMVMVARAIQAAKKQEIQGAKAALEGFKDAGGVSGYALASVAGFVELGLIQGHNGMLEPKGQATRAETAVFLYRILNDTGL